MKTVSLSLFVAAVLAPLASSFSPSAKPVGRQSVGSQQLFSTLPLRPSQPMTAPLEQKEVAKPQEPASAAIKKEEEQQSLSGAFLVGITAVNALLLGSLLMFSTMAPTPATVGKSTTPAQERVRAVEARNQKLYEENLAAEQVTFVNGFDFF